MAPRPGRLPDHAPRPLLQGLLRQAVLTERVSGRPHEPFWKGDEAPLWVETRRIKKIARPYPETDREEYLNARRLDNRDGTGFLPRLLAAEDQIFDRTATFLEAPRTPEELAAFQDEMAAKGLETLRSVKP